MTCKELFEAVRKAPALRYDLETHVEELRTMAEKITQQYSNCSGGGGGDVRKLENVTAKITAAIEQLMDMIDRQTEMEATALYVISKVPNQKHKELLCKRFIMRRTIQACADEMGYQSWYGCCQALGAAMAAAKKIYDDLPKKF